MSAILQFVWYNSHMNICTGTCYKKLRMQKKHIYALIMILLFLFSNTTDLAFVCQGFSFSYAQMSFFSGFGMYSAMSNIPLVAKTVKSDMNAGTPVGYIDLEDGYAVIDTDDRVMGIMTGEAPAGIPLFKGLQIRSLVRGEILEEKNKHQFHVCITILNAILYADQQNAQNSDFILIHQVKDIRYVDAWTQLLTITLPEDQRLFTIRISGIENIQEDMEWLRFAVAQNMFEEAKEGVLYMSDGNPTFRKMKDLHENK